MPLFAEYDPVHHGGALPAALRTRLAIPTDAVAIAALRVERGDATPEVARASTSRLLTLASGDGPLVIVAELDGLVVGYGVAHHPGPAGLPPGWYLGGVIVATPHRRLGIGARVTQERLDWIRVRAPEAYYFVNERNRASIDLHARFGFRQVARDLQVPGVTFTGGAGLLFRADL